MHVYKGMNPITVAGYEATPTDGITLQHHIRQLIADNKVALSCRVKEL